MGLNKSDGITRNNQTWSNGDAGFGGMDLYQKSINQMKALGISGLGGTSLGGSISDPYEPRYTFDGDSLKDELNLTQVTDSADQLKAYGDSLFSIFDQYQGNFDYLGENAGVSDTELQNRLGLSSSNFQANADSQKQEYERDMRRMGVNPNSAKFAGFGTSNALQKAAGLSLAQNEVREKAREETWQENMQVAELGLNAGKAGADAVGYAASAYQASGKAFSDSKVKYEQLNESARQYDNSYGQRQNELKLKAQAQAFGQGQDRWTNGMLQTNTYGGFGQLNSSTYDTKY